MSSIMEQQQGVRQGRRRARRVPQQRPSEGKSLSKGRGRTLLTDNLLWSRFFNLLLLLCFINSIGCAPAGYTPRHVTGEKGGNVTLPCEFEPRDDVEFSFNRQSKSILVCQNEECRFVKKGTCDIIIKDLIFSDAGKYIQRLRHTNDQREVKQLILEYHLHIQGKIFGKMGEELKMNILLANADKVKMNSSGEWTEVWTRGHGVSSDRLTDRDGNLTISNFTVSDTGTYRVLDSEGEILITVTVTGSSPGSKGKRDTDEDKPDNNTEAHKFWIIVLCVIGALLVLVVLVISALIWKRRRQNRNTDQRVYQDVPMQDI